MGLGSFLLKKINKLLIPFFFFYLTAFGLQYVVYLLFPHYFQLPVNLKELLVMFQGHDLIRFNPPIWYLLALFNCSILFYLVHYMQKRSQVVMYVVCSAIGIAGFTLGKLQIVLPLYIDVAMTALPFYAGGHWLTRYKNLLHPQRSDKYIPIVAIVAIIVMLLFANKIGMRTNSYTGNFFGFYMAGYAGVMLVLLLCKLVNNIPVISYLGRYSIVTLGIHGPLLFFGFKYLTKFIDNPVVLSFTMLISILVICRLTTPIILKLIPQLVAQKDFIQVRI